MNLFPSPVELTKLPNAIWFQPGQADPLVYRGTPVEIVTRMSEELGTTGVQQTVASVLIAIAKSRKLMIRLPTDLNDPDLAALFVHALLETRIGKPVPLA